LSARRIDLVSRRLSCSQDTRSYSSRSYAHRCTSRTLNIFVTPESRTCRSAKRIASVGRLDIFTIPLIVMTSCNNSSAKLPACQIDGQASYSSMIRSASPHAKNEHNLSIVSWSMRVTFCFAMRFSVSGLSSTNSAIRRNVRLPSGSWCCCSQSRISSTNR